jgi:hypothetical protein
MAGQAHRKHSVLLGAALCLLGTLLAALPALGLQLSPAAPADQAFTSKASRPDQAWLTHLRISGRIPTVLRPGVFSPIVLSFRNDSSAPVQMQRVRAKIKSLIAPNATPAHPCTRMDFEIHQMPAGLFHIPVGRTDLAGLGLPTNSWPELGMRNRPINQDGCKGVQVVLRLRALRVAPR